MDAYARHEKVWRILQILVRGYLHRRFALTSEPCPVEGPCIVIPNHVTNWDPFLVAMSFPRKQMYYVASEHIFRLPVLSRLIDWLLHPIARKKGDSGADAVMEILRRLRQGRSVCLFAEGDCSWDGLTNPIFPATGKLVRASGATLVTYRLEGGYLTWPRWAKKGRRGRLHGHAVGVYPPEELRKMKGPEITALIQRDIGEDAWARQASEPAPYRGRDLAEQLETALFLCPRCRRVGTLVSRGDTLRCTGCGLEERYLENGSFLPGDPFANVGQWDRWQHRELAAGRFIHGEELFSDPVRSFRKVLSGHRTERLPGQTLSIRGGCLCCGDAAFPLTGIDNMAMVKRHILLFTVGKDYYELRCGEGCSLRKYLAVWKNASAGPDKEA